MLLLPFIAYLVAEELNGSGILAVVGAAFMASSNLTFDPKHQYPGAHRTRLMEEPVWKVVDFLLENFVFAYIGLQLKFVLDDLKDETPGLATVLIAGVVLLVAAVGVRMFGVFALFGRRALAERWANWLLANDARFRVKAARRQEEWQRRGRVPLGATSFREDALVGWTGMRGILTLAAAAAVPEHTSSGGDFPGRDAIQAIALIVTLGTLLIQGTTLRRLAVALKFDVDAEQQEAEKTRQRGRELVTAAVDHDGPLTPEDYDRQRQAAGEALMTEHLDEAIMRELVDDIDFRQTAAERAWTA